MSYGNWRRHRKCCKRCCDPCKKKCCDPCKKCHCKCPERKKKFECWEVKKSCGRIVLCCKEIKCDRCGEHGHGHYSEHEIEETEIYDTDDE